MADLRHDEPDFDLLVIGGGAAGMAAARLGVRRHRRTALVQDGEVGGDCTFTGCVPSKTLIAAAAEGTAFAAAMARVRRTVAQIAATETADVLRGEGIDVVEGRASFVGPRLIQVGGRRLAARRIVIATGTAPLEPPIPGLAQTPHLTNETVFDLTEAPASLLVLGGGPIGCELAQAMARLGVSVTVVEAGDRLLSKEEPRASAVIRRALEQDGVEVRTGAKVTRVQSGPNGIQAELTDATTQSGTITEVGAALLLVAVGRRPVTSGLGLDAAGVDRDDRGYVRTDDRLATNVDGVYAAGDITGRLPFTHAADEMGRVAASNALSRRSRQRFHAESTPWVTFTDPEVARVGMTEAEAAAVGGRVAHLPMTAVDRAVTAGRTEGFITLLAASRRGIGTAGGGRLVGATIVAPHAGEMIHELALAVRTHMFTGRLAQTVHAYPTYATGIRAAASQFFLTLDGRTAQPARRDTSSD